MTCIEVTIGHGEFKKQKALIPVKRIRGIFGSRIFVDFAEFVDCEESYETIKLALETALS